MNLSFLLSSLMFFLFFTGCGEKLLEKEVSPAKENKFVDAQDFKDDNIKQAPGPKDIELEEDVSLILPPTDSSDSYFNGGYLSGGGGRGHLLKSCFEVEGNSCDTGDPSPFGEGKIICENGQRICRSNVTELLYYLYIEDFIESFIEIPTSNVLGDSSTISSKYLAGRAPIYDRLDEKAGTCSASFLCMQNQDGIFTDISNYLSVDNGLIVSWFTSTTLINLELDSIVNSMVTECIVLASTKILLNPFYGETFNMIVSADEDKIYFQLTRIDD